MNKEVTLEYFTKEIEKLEKRIRFRKMDIRFLSYLQARDKRLYGELLKLKKLYKTNQHEKVFKEIKKNVDK